MPNHYKPASDSTLAFFRKDTEQPDRPQLESILISRVVMGEILARLDRAEAQIALGIPDVDYGPVWVDVIDTPTKPPYGSPERAISDAKCDGCSEPNRCGGECPDA